MNLLSNCLNRYHPSTCYLSRPLFKLKDDEFRVAGYKLLSAFVTDNPKNAEKFPKYEWKNRAKPMIEFIKKDHPEILALYEFNIPQAKTLRESLGEQYDLIGYSSELGLPIEEIERLIEDATASRAKGEEAKDPYYGEFVGFMIDKDQFSVESVKCHSLPDGARHKRILVEANLIHQATKTHICAFSSHFDHISLESRMKSGEIELDLIAKKIENGIACISFGDRNWFPDASGQECWKHYVESGLVKDIRDNHEGHFGPMGTFPGHLDLPAKFAPNFSKDKEGRDIIDANTLDVGFVSKHLDVRYSYTDYVSFDPESGKLLTNETPGDLKKKLFASDHYPLGAVIKILK